MLPDAQPRVTVMEARAREMAWMAAERTWRTLSATEGNGTGL